MEPQELTLSMESYRVAKSSGLAAFEQLMVRHQRQVLMTALRLLGRMEDAQDAAQEVFLRLYKYSHRYDDSRDLAPWLYRVTVNVCHDMRRRLREIPVLENTDLAGKQADPDASLDMETKRRLIR